VWFRGEQNLTVLKGERESEATKSCQNLDKGGLRWEKSKKIAETKKKGKTPLIKKNVPGSQPEKGERSNKK